MVLSRAQQPLFVIPLEAHNLGGAFVSKRKNGVYATSRVGPSVEVIAEEDQDVAFSDCTA